MPQPSDKETTVAVIGAGPAGLTAAYLLTKKGVSVTVFEANEEYVGGIARTARYKGYHFDIGGHRFFSKSQEVEDLWTELLPDDMLHRPRSSRIFYRGKFFSYPLKPFEALLKLGFFQSLMCVLSYLKARAFPIPNPKNFQDWVSNQFGSRLFNIFFKTYTEKVWGMSCRDISADWAVQRIKGLSLGTAIFNSFKITKNNGDRSQVIKTLIDTFRYPRKGPGMLWEACAKKILSQGGEIRMGTKVTGCRLRASNQKWMVSAQDTQGSECKIIADHVISSAPLRELANGIEPRISEKALAAANALKYRDFLTVMLILEDRELFSDNWIYIHEPGVQVGRVQNFKSWSPEMVPDPSKCCYGLEYFCFEGDGLWESSDAELIALAKTELEKIGLAKQEEVLDGCVVRQKKAYPVYDDSYQKNVDLVRKEFDRRFPGLHLVGRNGMHKYNNQDHAMMTAMLCTENIVQGRKVFDLWEVNQDAEYHETGKVKELQFKLTKRDVPTKVK